MVYRVVAVLVIAFFQPKVAKCQEDTTLLQTIINVTSERINSEKPNASYLKIRGWAYYCLDSLRLAESDYDEAISIEPDNGDLYFRRGDIKFDLDKLSESVNDYSRAISLLPDSLNYYVSRAVSLEAIGKLKDALIDYNHVLAVSPHHELGLRNRAILYCKGLKDSRKGFMDWDELIKANPKPEYFNDRGLILMGLGEYDSAIKDFDSALQSNSDNAGHYLANKGYCLAKLGKIGEALASFDRSEKLNPENGHLYKYRGQLYLITKDFDKACKDLMRANKMGLEIDLSNIRCPN